MSKVPPRCAEIQTRFEAAISNTLGPTAAGEVQGHILSCQVCNDAFGELLMEKIETEKIPLEDDAPFAPPIEMYERYISARVDDDKKK